MTIWPEVLGVERIGIDDHSVDLGGNSLSAMQLHTRLRTLRQDDFPICLLFEVDTIAQLALLITQQQAAQLPMGASHLGGLQRRTSLTVRCTSPKCGTHPLPQDELTGQMAALETSNIA